MERLKLYSEPSLIVTKEIFDDDLLRDYVEYMLDMSPSIFKELIDPKKVDEFINKIKHEIREITANIAEEYKLVELLLNSLEHEFNKELYIVPHGKEELIGLAIFLKYKRPDVVVLELTE